MEVSSGARKVFRCGASLAVTLPREWVVRHKVKDKDPLPFMVVDGVLRYIPIDENHPIMRREG